MRNLAITILVAACGGGDDVGGAADGGPGASDAADDGGTTGCPRELAPDGARRVVVSHPYDAAGGQSPRYRVLELSADGELTDTTATFELGRATAGAIAFTPDGEVAFATQDDGTIGVVAFDGDAPRVVDPGVDGVYASSLAVDPAGDRLWVLDEQWRKHGGGVYTRAIGCDGALGPPVEVGAARLPRALIPLDGGRAILVAADVLDSAPERDAHLLDLSGGAPRVLSSVDAFPDDAAEVPSAALTDDGRHLIIADNSEYSGIPNRIAVVALDGDALEPRQVFGPIQDPYRVLASPFGGAVLVVSGYGDALFAFDHDAEAAEPLALRGEFAYAGAPPMLPGEVAMIRRGALEGLVLVAEVDGVRQVRFGPGGALEDLGLFELAGGAESVVGAIGVAP